MNRRSASRNEWANAFMDANQGGVVWGRRNSAQEPLEMGIEGWECVWVATLQRTGTALVRERPEIYDALGLARLYFPQ